MKLSGEVRRPQIAMAALQIIAEHGVSGFTTRALSRAVGLAEGTIFRHFGSKEEIVQVAIDHLEQMLGADLVDRGEGDAIDRLGRFFRRRVELIGAHPGVMRILFSDELARAGGAEDAARVGALKRRAQELVQSLISEAGEEGILAAGVSPDILAVIVQGAALAVLFDVHGSGGGRGELDPQRLWQALETLMRRRLRST